MQQTSLAANSAATTSGLKQRHRQLIMDVLNSATMPLSAMQIASKCTLDATQILRRMDELVSAGLIFIFDRNGRSASGQMSATITDIRIDEEINIIKKAASDILEIAYEMCEPISEKDRKDRLDILSLHVDDIKGAIDEVDSNFDDVKDENDKLVGEINDLEEKLEEVEELNNPVVIDTMIGELSYTTSNLMDCQVMEEFSKSIANIQPIKLLELLQGINNVSIKPNSTWVK